MQLNILQQSLEWHELRKISIGASEASTILGINPWETAYQLWQRKMGLIEPIKKTEAMQRGLDLENAARAKFEALTDIKTKPVVLRHPNIPYMIASLDGITEDGKVILEIKCPNEETHNMAKNGKIPDYYQAQIMHQLCVSGADKAYYATYRNDEMHIVSMFMDLELLDRILESQNDFYRRMTEFDPPLQKHRIDESREMINAVIEYRMAYANQKEAERILLKSKQKVLQLSGEECIQSGSLKVTHYFERGRVNYDAILEHLGVNIDLDKYRKPAIKKSRISIS